MHSIQGPDEDASLHPDSFFAAINTDAQNLFSTLTSPLWNAYTWCASWIWDTSLNAQALKELSSMKKEVPEMAIDIELMCLMLNTPRLWDTLAEQQGIAWTSYLYLHLSPYGDAFYEKKGRTPLEATGKLILSLCQQQQNYDCLFFNPEEQPGQTGQKKKKLCLAAYFFEAETLHILHYSGLFLKQFESIKWSKKTNPEFCQQELLKLMEESAYLVYTLEDTPACNPYPLMIIDRTLGSNYAEVLTTPGVLLRKDPETQLIQPFLYGGSEGFSALKPFYALPGPLTTQNQDKDCNNFWSQSDEMRSLLQSLKSISANNNARECFLPLGPRPLYQEALSALCLLEDLENSSKEETPEGQQAKNLLKDLVPDATEQSEESVGTPLEAIKQDLKKVAQESLQEKFVQNFLDRPCSDTVAAHQKSSNDQTKKDLAFQKQVKKSLQEKWGKAKKEQKRLEVTLWNQPALQEDSRPEQKPKTKAKTPPKSTTTQQSSAEKQASIEWQKIKSQSHKIIQQLTNKQSVSRKTASLLIRKMLHTLPKEEIKGLTQQGSHARTSCKTGGAFLATTPHGSSSQKKVSARELITTLTKIQRAALFQKTPSESSH